MLKSAFFNTDAAASIILGKTSVIPSTAFLIALPAPVPRSTDPADQDRSFSSFDASWGSGL